MKISEEIARVDRLKPNQFTEEDKVRWLSELDGMVWKELVMAHHPPDGGYGDMPSYTMDDIDDELLIPVPYTNVYDYWMMSQIDLHNGELGKYNNSTQMYNSAYQAYSDYYTREHMPLQRVTEFLL